MKNIKNYENIYHLSHIDLDGYASQLILNEFFKMNFLKNNISFYNVDYGNANKELNIIFKKMLEKKEETHYLFITDLALNENEVKKINNFKKGNKHINVEIKALDHHKTSKKLAEDNEWLNLDIQNCATRMTYHFLTQSFQKNKFLNNLSLLVQAHDLWEENSIYFNKRNFLRNTIFTFLIKYPDIIKKKQIEQYLFVIKKIGEKLINDITVTQIQREIYDINTDFIKNKIEDKYAKNKDLSYEEKLYRFFYLEIKKKQETELKEFYINDKKGICLFDLGESFQHVSKHFLKGDKSLDFVLHMKKTKKLSLRSKKGVDVEKIAKQYFNGGGHENASGGKLDTEEEILSQSQANNYFVNNYKNFNQQIEL